MLACDTDPIILSAYVSEFVVLIFVCFIVYDFCSATCVTYLTAAQQTPPARKEAQNVLILLILLEITARLNLNSMFFALFMLLL